MMHQKVLPFQTASADLSRDLLIFLFFFPTLRREEKTKDNKEKIKLNRQLPHLVWMPQFHLFFLKLFRNGGLDTCVDSSYRILLAWTVSIVMSHRCLAHCCRN